MRHLLTLLGCASVLVTGALQACAQAEADPSPPAPGTEAEDASTLPAVDADVPEHREPDAFPEPERCSAAGWCEVSPPEYGSYTLHFSGIWPLVDRAFVYGASYTPDNASSLPAALLEWDYASKTFTRIDDGRHNWTRGSVMGVFAPNKDEAYYVASHFGVNGAEVYHGRRPVPPAKEWSWTTHKLGCSVRTIPTMWGIGADVYVVGCKKIYRHSPDGGDGGTETWIEDVVETDSTADFGGIAATTPDNVWFYGTKTGCPYILRKTAAGYERVAEGTYERIGRACQPTDGLLTFTGYPTVISVSSALGVAASGELLVLRSDGKQLARIGPADAGGYTIAYASPLPTVPEGITLTRVWGGENDTLWFITSENSILRVTDAWTDGGASIQYSTLARNGAPNDKPLTLLLGTSNSNLWAVGDYRAFHKSTP